MAPENLPPGVSPDNQDGCFEPGSFGSRPALQRVFAAPFPDGGSCVYAKSFVTPQNTIINLYLTSNGTLYTENINTGAGTLKSLFVTVPGSVARSVTAFGREFIAISDALHGADFPLQYDGTNLNRVTQEGPGGAPLVSSIAFPSVAMLAVGSAPTFAIVSITPSDRTVIPAKPGSEEGPTIFFASFTVVTALASGVTAFGGVSISGNGNSDFNSSWTVSVVLSPTSFKCSAYFPEGEVHGLGGTLTSGTSGVTLTRTNNSVLVTTATAHGLQVGYQALTAGVVAQTVGTAISSVVINNEDLPGIATVTTSDPHGLTPGLNVQLLGITAVSVGTGISTTARAGGIVTITTSAAHGLKAGSLVTTAGVSDASFNVSITVESVPSTTSFTFFQNDTTDATSSGGTVSLVWPVSDNLIVPTYFEVLSAPTPTTFQVQVTYGDATWTDGTVTFDWNGTFYVTSVPSSTSAVYQQYGPDGTSTTVGSVTPYGQIAPGLHQIRCSFLTNQGYLTRPGPWTTFIANGGQYLSITGLPTGPGNIVARVIESTGAQGSNFFYIPVAAQVNGITVSTATQIDDNTTTSVILDYSDNTLFQGLGTTVPGNYTSRQVVLDGALGFAERDTRVVTWGQRETIQQLLSMMFGGGFDANNMPLGWTYNAQSQSTGAAVAGRLGYDFAWQISCTNDGSACGLLSQGVFQDVYNSPILKGNTFYTYRLWMKANSLSTLASFKVTLSSASTGFSTSKSITFANIGATGRYVELAFPQETPGTIPPDMTLTISASSTTPNQVLTIGEMWVVYTLTPYLDDTLYGSYGNNPEAFDNLTGDFGPETDTRKVMDVGLVRDNLYILTQEPSGRLHEVYDNGTSEPSGWTINELDSNCGALSAFCLTHSQADDSSASGGEEWMSWASESGARIFGGGLVHKISQEIQPNWFDPTTPTPRVPAGSQINMAAAQKIWGMNDPVARVIYFGLPIGANTSDNLIYPISYRELDSAEAIANAPPFHPSLGGRLIATDNTRKWTRWNIPTTGPMVRMYRNTYQLSCVLLAGFNCYTLNPNKYTDDDFGQIFPYYVTALLPTHDQEQALQLDAGLKILKYLAATITGIGTVNISVFCNNLSNAWPLSVTRTLTTVANFDLEWGGASARGQRMAFKVASSPLAGQTDNKFNLSKIIPWFAKNRFAVRGAAQ